MGKKWGPRRAGKLELGDEAAGGRKEGSPGVRAALCHLGLGALGAPLSRRPLALGRAAQGPRLAAVGTSGLQQRWGPGPGPGGGDGRMKGWERAGRRR